MSCPRATLTRKKAPAAASHHQPPVVQISQYNPNINAAFVPATRKFRLAQRHSQPAHDSVLRWNRRSSEKPE